MTSLVVNLLCSWIECSFVSVAELVKLAVVEKGSQLQGKLLGALQIYEFQMLRLGSSCGATASSLCCDVALTLRLRVKAVVRGYPKR